ncbi:MAG: hypothetical protein HOV81_25300 [Kofleriaceae bacterium]|nr:hypothetical protein [Kofleriaceae bacterium]
MKLSNISFVIALALAGGCVLTEDDGTKNACQAQEDCLSGYQCVDNVCVTGGGSNMPGTYYGTVEPMTPASSGLSAENYETLAALTTAPGPLGCAVVGDVAGSPGANAAVVYAKVSKESGDTRCPSGSYAIVNDPDLCHQSFPSDLHASCAIYRRWNASGQQSANQLAIGGYVSIQNTYVNDMLERCDVDMSIQFAGGVAIAKKFQFDYNPLAPTAAFCVH